MCLQPFASMKGDPMPRRALLAALLAFAALAGLAPAAWAAFPGRNGRLAFNALDAQQHSGLFTEQPNGTGLFELHPGSLAQPSWSPDGRRLLFTDGGRLGAIDADGSHFREVTISPSNVHAVDRPAWSPDGRRVAFTGLIGGT